MISTSSEVTPRESLEHEWRVMEFEKTAEHTVKLKELEIELARENHQADIELRKLEAKWSSWLKIPRLIILLPVLIILSFKTDHKRFWELLS